MIMILILVFPRLRMRMITILILTAVLADCEEMSTFGGLTRPRES
jgi:hypothetical protein